MSPPVPSPTPPNDAPESPVLIAGAGPVGLCAALVLACLGVASTIFESRSAPGGPHTRQTGSRAICFQRDVLDILDRLDVASRLLAEGTTWTTARTYVGGHEVRTVTFNDHDTDFAAALPPWINISQARVEEELLRATAAEPLITFRYDHRVVAVRQDATGVTVDTDGPRGRDVSRGEYLVGADGARSTVRQSLAVDFPGTSFTDRFLICDIRTDLPFPNERRFYFDPAWNPGRQVLVHQCPDSVWRIDWQVPADYDLHAERDGGALDARIRRVVGDRPYELVWSSVYRFHERCARRFRQGRVFLAGDAAHLFAPFGARGLNSGIQDAENLAWKIGYVHRGYAPSGARADLLESYHEERWAAAQENLRVTDATMRFLVPRDEEQRRWRSSVLRRCLTEPAARAEIDSGKLAEPYRYTDSRLTTPWGTEGDVPGEPGSPRPPVPGVICPDGPCALSGRPEVARLRRLFTTGFTVLSARTDQARAIGDATYGIGVPVRSYALEELDPGGSLAGALRCDGDTAHIVRPDAHLCAVLPARDTAAQLAAVRRACGAPTVVGLR